MAVDPVGRYVANSSFIQKPTRIHENEGKSNNPGWMLYSVYDVLDVCCTYCSQQLWMMRPWFWLELVQWARFGSGSTKIPNYPITSGSKPESHLKLRFSGSVLQTVEPHVCKLRTFTPINHFTPYGITI